MNLENIKQAVAKAQIVVEQEIINHMVERNVEIYSFVGNKEKPMIVIGNLKEQVMALHYDGYSLGVMLESDLTPLRSKFLRKQSIYTTNDNVEKELEILSARTPNGSDGFILLTDNAAFPTDALLTIAYYLHAYCK